MRVVLLCFGLLLLCGCARVATTTTIAADGSYSRKTVYTVSKNNMGGGGPETATDAKKKEKPEDFFKMPAGAKVVKSETKNDLIATVTRDLAPGSPALQDIALYADKGKILATSSVTVRKLPNGDVEYLEMLHAVQPNDKPKD